MQELTKIPRTLNNGSCLIRQTDTARTDHTPPGARAATWKQQGRGALVGMAFPNAFLSTAHISEYVEAKRRPQKWKIGRCKENPLRQRFKVNFRECLGGECVLEFDKGTEDNGSLLFWCWGTVLNWLIRNWNCVNKLKSAMKAFSHADGLLSKSQNTVTLYPPREWCLTCVGSVQDLQ